MVPPRDMAGSAKVARASSARVKGVPLLQASVCPFALTLLLSVCIPNPFPSLVTDRLCSPSFRLWAGCSQKAF